MNSLFLILRGLTLKTLFLMFSFACLTCISLPSLATDQFNLDNENQLKINKIKSAYLYNFLKYITLPQHPDKSDKNYFSVCIFGNNPFGRALDSLSGRIAKGLEVKVKKLTELKETLDCDIIYVSQSEINNIDNLFAMLKNNSILTVSDITDFAHKGGVIGFITHNEKIGIEINLNNARQANIRISASLLEIAKLTE